MSCERKICIIGGGIAGISALRVFSETIANYPLSYSIEAFERSDRLGGIWNYNEDIEGQFVGPMYRDLRTNLPKEVMAFPDFRFSSDLSDSFIHHTDVLRYITSYVDHFDLERFVEYNSEITNVEPVKSDELIKWKVMIKNTLTLTIVEKWFDVVLICNGHFEIPKIPLIKGIENFKGECIHSKYYRTAEKYFDKTVFVLGAKSSGLDIALQLLEVAKMVYLSHNRNRLVWDVGKNNFQETYGISYIDDFGNVCLIDGAVYQADVIIFCTGYEINLNFLSKSAGLKWDNTYVRPLYKHLINPYFPTSCFIIGLAYEIAPLTHFYMQSKVARAIVQQCSVGIPLSINDMLVEIKKTEEEFEKNKVEMRHRHYFCEKEWPYLRWCEKSAEKLMNVKVPKHLEMMFEIVRKWRYQNTDKYRDVKFRLVDNKLGFEIARGPDEDFYSADFREILSNKHFY